jgi:long-chain acyl-CoA synthetase
MIVGTPAVFEFITHQVLKQQARALGTYLRCSAGIAEKEKISIWSANSVEWLIADMSCYAYNYVSVSVYDTLGPDAASYIIADSSSKVLVCEEKTFKKVPAALKDPTYAQNPGASLEIVVCIGTCDAAAKVELEKMGIKVVNMKEAVKSVEGNLTPDTPPKDTDLATLMYTSGTTGMPKGVMITHRSLVATMLCGQVHATNVYFESTDVHLSYLPLAHIFERQVVLNTLYAGGKIYIGGGARTLMADLAVVRPTIFPGVPKVFENIRDGVNAKLQGKAKQIFQKAMAAKRNYLENGGYYCFMWDLLVFNKTKKALGGRVRFCITGGAPISAETLRFVQCCIGPIVQGYGATETVGSSLTMPWDLSVGHVGPPVPSTVIRLVDVPDMNYYCGPKSVYKEGNAKAAFDEGKAKSGGEVWIGGPGVSPGYYDPSVNSNTKGIPSNGMAKKTKEDFFSEDGWSWFKTGDIGSWTEDGCLKIVDRRKNMFKTTLGEYIPVEEVEKTYQDMCPWADFVFLPKETKVPYVGLVVVVSDSIGLVMRWAKENGIEGDSSAVVASDTFKKELFAKLDAAADGKKLASFMRVKPKNVYVEHQPIGYQEDWVAGVPCANGHKEQLLTATFKARRSSLDQYYAPIFKTMYPDRPSDHILP